MKEKKNMTQTSIYIVAIIAIHLQKPYKYLPDKLHINTNTLEHSIFFSFSGSTICALATDMESIYYYYFLLFLVKDRETS